MNPPTQGQLPLQLRAGDCFYLERDKAGRLATGFMVCSMDSAGTLPMLERKRRRHDDGVHGDPGLKGELQRGPNGVLNTPGFLSDVHACFWSRAHTNTMADLAVKAGAKRDYSAHLSTTHVVLK